MTQQRFFKERIGDDGVAHLTLARPEKHNAFNAELIESLTDSLRRLATERGVRCLVLSGEGSSFSAGADLEWMRAMAEASEEENLEDARALARMLETLDGFPAPTVALVQGPAMGGGVGLVACCDIAIASQEAVFALSEVRLGLIPATIHPYVVGAIGHRAARRYTLTGERIDAWEAYRIALVHMVVEDGAALHTAGRRILDTLLKGGPVAQRESKAQIRALSGGAPDAGTREDSARRIAALRVGAEGQEGIAAFLEKRKPGWQA